jgi:ABC-type bacteriocin/lantibiotic exporter with double-glycine peptidase domain
MSQTAWRYYIGCYRGSYARLLLTVAVSIAHSLLVFPVVLLVKYVFDTVLPASDFRLLVFCGAAMLGATLAANAVYLWIRATILRITKIAIRDLRFDLLERLYELSRNYLTQADRSVLHARIVQDTERVDVMSNAVVAQVLPGALVSLALCVFLVWLNATMFLVLLTVVPVMYLLNRMLGKKLRARVSEFRRSFEDFSKGVLFVLQAMDLTRAHSAERQELERQRRQLEELRRTSAAMALLDALTGLSQGSLTTIAGLVILVVGGRAVTLHTMTIGELLSYYVTLRYLNTYMQLALSSIPQMILGNESLRSLYDLLETNDRQPYAGTRRLDFAGDVTLDSLHFAYREGHPVLQGLSMRLEPSTTTALIGPNGSGKSTVVSLLYGFYRPQRGRLTAGGLPYDEWDMRELRRYFGWVPQAPFLFPGSIAENIAYGTAVAGPAEIVEAAELATAHEFILKLDRGYDTPVGDGGLLLSGGQRQRIAIARALLRRPRLLILDEPTNHMDHSSVTALLARLLDLPFRPAILLISHDPAIIRHATAVFTLEDGKVSLAGAEDVASFVTEGIRHP